MTGASARIDLRQVACPLTYVRTCIALERLRPGEVLEVWLASGVAVESVPRSAEEDGHRVVGMEALAPDRSSFRVLLRKGAPSGG